DTVGLLARSAADVGLCFSVFTHANPALPAIDKPRIGFYRTLQWSKADAAARLGKAGARVREITMPEKFSELSAARNIVGDYETSRALAWERLRFEDKISTAVREKQRKADAVTYDQF